MRLKQYILDINSKYKAFLPLSVLALSILGYALLMATGSETKPISAPERSWSVTAQEAQYGDIQQNALGRDNRLGNLPTRLCPWLFRLR